MLHQHVEVLPVVAKFDLDFVDQDFVFAFADPFGLGGRL